MNNSSSHDEAVLILNTSPIVLLCESPKLWYIGDYHIRSLIPYYFLNPRTFHDDIFLLWKYLEIYRWNWYKYIWNSWQTTWKQPECVGNEGIFTSFKMSCLFSVRFGFVHLTKFSLGSWALLLLKWCKNVILRMGIEGKGTLLVSQKLHKEMAFLQIKIFTICFFYLVSWGLPHIFIKIKWSLNQENPSKMLL